MSLKYFVSRIKCVHFSIAAFVFSSSLTLAESELKFSGVAGLEARVFSETALLSQDDEGFSLMLEPEWYWSWDDSSVTVKPFARVDSMDDERTHFDLREAYWETVGDEWSLRVGVDKVFWGVAETQHLVDIINQTDAVENIDGEDKLGQLMVNFALEKEWGTLSFFILPRFRERTFAGDDGRLRQLLTINTGRALYQSSDEDDHLDFAVRYATSVEEWDFGFSIFDGTSREPEFRLNPLLNGGFELLPYYPQITQAGIDIQATLDDWLIKFEAIYRTGFGGQDYFAAVTGFEYTLYGVFDTVIDLGIILEYQFDEREELVTTFGSIELSDVVIWGGRFAFNDEQSSELLLGLGIETDNDAQFFSMEGARRIGDDMKLSIEGRAFTGIDANRPDQTMFYSLRRDDFIQITLEKYY